MPLSKIEILDQRPFEDSAIPILSIKSVKTPVKGASLPDRFDTEFQDREGR